MQEDSEPQMKETVKGSLPRGPLKNCLIAKKIILFYADVSFRAYKILNLFASETEGKYESCVILKDLEFWKLEIYFRSVSDWVPSSDKRFWWRNAGPQ